MDDPITEYQCWSLLMDMAPDVFDGSCPFSDTVQDCKLECYQNYTNGLYAMSVAGCPDDILHCDVDDEESCDGDEGCNAGNGQCYQKCDTTTSMGCNPGEVCMDGLCRNPDDGEDYSMGLLDFSVALGWRCLMNDAGELCWGDWFTEEWWTVPHTCEDYLAAGCCADTLFALPEVSNPCEGTPGYQPGPQCPFPGWFNWSPEIGDYNTVSEDFCESCQAGTWDFLPCEFVAGRICDSGLALDYCGHPLCENYGELNDAEKALCHGEVQASASEVCQCVICDADGKPVENRRRHLSFGGTSLCCPDGW